jgi:xanthine/uracil permease
VGVFQTFKLLGYIRENAAFSKNSLQGLRIIKYCAMILVVFILIPEFYLLIVRPGDDIAGGVAIGLFLIVLSGIVATISAVFEKRTRKVI